MAKNKKQRTEKEPEKTTADYYKLNVQAVEDLVNADETNSPQVSDAELRKYRSGPRVKLSDWLKAVLLKAWFAGVVCYFFVWGLSTISLGQIELFLILGVALGFLTDLIANPLFRLYAKPAGANDRWMMFPRKGFQYLPLNVLYALLLVFCVVTTYNAVNTLLYSVNGAQDGALLGVEPILFGLFTMGWDMLFLFFKGLFKKILLDAKKKTPFPK